MADLVIASILESVKKILGLSKEYDSFDQDILIHINTVFSNLTQMGIGPLAGFVITGYDETWDSYTLTDPMKSQQIKSYVALKVKMIFDPPSNGNVLDAMKRSIEEMEYRLFTEEDIAAYQAYLATLVVDEEE